MKSVIGLSILFISTSFLGSTSALDPSTALVEMDTSLSKIVFFEDFANNINNWTIPENKNATTSIDNGIYYLTALGHSYGAAHEVKIDTHKNFEIETRIKIVAGNSDHKTYYSMLFWGREGMNSYYFTFSKDGFVSVEQCTSKNQSSCVTQKGSLQKTALDPDGFNIYMIRKTGNLYSFFVNGIQFYEMPFSPFFGNLIGFGAGRKVTLAIDYLKVTYL
jgi:hypothetical protein